MFSCDKDDNPVSTSNEIEVDWVLIRDPNTDFTFPSEDTVVGYYFLYKESLMDFSNNYIDFPLMDEDPLIFNQIGQEDIYISFIYNGESFSFDLSDINYESVGRFSGMYEDVDRIIYNTDMDYFLIFHNTFSTSPSIISSSNPNELIDYR